MPSKLLIAAAEAAHMLQAAPGFGVHPGQVRIDGKAVMARVRSERDRFVGFVLEGVDGYSGRGQAARPCALSRPAPGCRSTTIRRSRRNAS
jgi:pyruvate/2-oxoglutarate dehydrogenase complex dihydrolipoamide dehydrogenase (E3) component